MASKSKNWQPAIRSKLSLPRGWQHAGLQLWVTVILGMGVIGLLAAGCASTSHQTLALQAAAKIKEQRTGQELQKQLLAQATQAPLLDYKDYQVGPEDLLTVNIFGQSQLSGEVRVNGQGEITMPLIGGVKVAGLTTQEIERRLKEAYGSNYLVNPQVQVAVKEFRHQRVAVTGAVAKPGSYEIIGPRTLLEVLAMAGGFASGSGVQAGDTINLIRSQSAPDLAKAVKENHAQPFAAKAQTIVIDLRRLMSGQVPELNLPVKNGDVIHVPFAGTAYVLGGVRRPGNIAVKENITVSQAVALAGGIDPILGTDNITIMRFDDQGQPISINTNLKNIITRQEADLPVKDSDVIVVKESGLKKSLYVIRTLLPIPSGAYSLQ